MTKFYEKIKELREENNLTQAKMAKLLGYTQAAIGKWEKGTRSPDLDDLVKIAKTFGVTTDYLLGLED